MSNVRFSGKEFLGTEEEEKEKKTLKILGLTPSSSDVSIRRHKQSLVKQEVSWLSAVEICISSEAQPPRK